MLRTLMLSSLVIFILSFPAFAQPQMPAFPPNCPLFNHSPQEESEPEPFRARVVIMGIRGDFFQVQTTNGETWVCKMEVPPEAVAISGTATPAWLQRGMFIKFSARLKETRQGAISTTPVSDLVLFTPREEYGVGIAPDQQFGGFGQEENAEEGTPCLVSGQIVGINGNALSINAGGSQVTVEVVEEPSIKVDYNDIRLVRIGDEANIEGYFFQRGQAIVNRLAIERGEPYGTPVEKPEEEAEGASEEEDLE